MSKKNNTPETTETRESDGRFALQMATSAAVQRQMRADAAREKRRQEIIAEYGADDLMWA